MGTGVRITAKLAKLQLVLSFDVTETTQELRLQIMDASGKCMVDEALEAANSGNWQWKVPSEFPVGLYSFSLTNATGSKSGKLIVQ